MTSQDVTSEHVTSEQTDRAHLTFKGVKLYARSPQFSMEFRPRAHALVCPAERDGDAFVRLASGMALALRGEIKLGDLFPAKNPALRAKIGSLLANEPLITSSMTVRHYLAHVLGVRHKTLAESSPSPENIPLVSSLLDEPAAGLDNRKRRLVALGLSFALTKPSLLVLYDPLRGLDGQATDFTLNTLRGRASNGAIVVCVTPTLRGASLLADKIHTFYHALPTATESYFIVRCERPRVVASALAKEDSIFLTKLLPSKALLIGTTSEEHGAKALTAALSSSQVEVFEVRRTHGTADVALELPVGKPHA